MSSTRLSESLILTCPDVVGTYSVHFEEEPDSLSMSITTRHSESKTALRPNVVGPQTFV